MGSLKRLKSEKLRVESGNVSKAVLNNIHQNRLCKGLSWIFSTLREFRLLSYAQSAQSRRYPAQVPSKNPLLTTHHSLLTNKKAAFTLAEILITLGIIGVVAALTIPTVIAKYQEKVTVTRLKQAYSILSQAFTNIIANEGTPDTWDLRNANEFRDLFARYIRNAKKCNANSGKKCQPDVTHDLHGDVSNNYNLMSDHSNLNLNNGTNLTFWYGGYVPNCDFNYYNIENSCRLAIHVDINGLKSPNTWGKDRFQFLVYRTKILPKGTMDMRDGGGYLYNYECFDENANGLSCAAWVIYNENMDYLKCPEELSWNGKTKCN